MMEAEYPPPDRHPVTGIPVLTTVIIGAGFAGLGLGIRLARRGDDSFVILERGRDVGGTWRDNRYPGVACDIPSHLYSFSFAPKADWSRFFAAGAEIQGYLRSLAQTEGLLAQLRFHEEALDVRWDDSAGLWLVTTTRAEYCCRNVVVAAGRLSEPHLPEVEGLDEFDGPIVHSSRWRDDLELAGKRVGVVGTGASAVQLIPHLAAVAESVVIFQRSAPYVIPRPDRRYTAAEIRRFDRDPAARTALRSRLFWSMEAGLAERRNIPGYIDRLRATAIGHLTSQIPDTRLRAALTPRYEIGCKRVLLSNDYYPALSRPTVTVETSALHRLNSTTATAESGASYELDVLVLATGFESTKPPFARIVTGKEDRVLSDTWSNGMAAFASTTVSGFPNLFVIDGPNASLGHNSAVYMIEAQIDYVLGAIDHQAESGETVLEISAASQAEYLRDLDERSAGTVWLEGGCSSWYLDETSNRLTLLWPDFAHTFRERVGRFDPAPYLSTASTRVSG
jgi:cation diffusion facilitator CzcD-associated flavoprotein CzcO